MANSEVGPRPATIAVLLSFVAAYVDTVGFVALFGLFTAHVTGNFVLIGAALAHARGGLIAKLAALPVFVLAVAATTVFVHARARAAKPALTGVLLVQTFCLLGFMAVGIAASPIVDVDAPLAVFAGLLGVWAMGTQNAASRLLMGELPPTTVMTGGVTQFAIDVTYLFGIRSLADEAAAKARLLKFAPPIVAFAVGAIAGAAIYAQAGFGALLVPIVTLFVVLLLLRAAPPAGRNPA
ncbi:MAG: permease [Nevskia sp.]|nr:permease [Nevskia sp.]